MLKKNEWRKHEKSVYLPKDKPEIINVPDFKFITIKGQGNPNSKQFSECIGALYSVAYGIKMHLKKAENKPDGYVDFTVYPLEGVWDITDKAKEEFNGTINKDDLMYHLMIRQPNFVDQTFFNQILQLIKIKKPNSLLDSVEFETMSEGLCIQMLHRGPFEKEHISFDKMERFAEEQGLERLSKVHREVYLSDARRVTPDKYKTILRFKAKLKVVV